jgi:myotubularin-related protein 1/2
MRVLSGARRVAEVLHEDGASVLVHCSDGWDRTPQLVGLAQLILDPYYRTIRGFAVLIEKEWCSFGHKFADRVGVGKDSTDQPNERSPVMLQFLDCVWQMTRQFPTAFEFNEKLLLHVADALTSGLYGSFLYNTERERIFEKVWERTESVWTPVLESPGPFKNPMFRATNRVIYPRANLKRVVLWDAMFFRWDPESHPDYMEYMNPVDPEDGGRDDDLAYDMGDPRRADFDEVEKALRLEIDEIHDFDEMRIRSALSDCSDMSDDDEMELRMSLSADHSPMINEEEFGNHDYGDKFPQQRVEAVDEFDDEELDRYRRGAEERTRQRAQGRNIREAIMMAPDQSRIKYLEQLLSESVARELQLEAELDSVQHRVAWIRNGNSSGNRKNSNTGSEANV